MTEFEHLPAWARRRLNRHLRRGGSGRILRWMSVPTGGGGQAEAPAAGERLIILAATPASVGGRFAEPTEQAPLTRISIVDNPCSLNGGGIGVM